jgi:hypothetical protein
VRTSAPGSPGRVHELMADVGDTVERGAVIAGWRARSSRRRSSGASGSVTALMRTPETVQLAFVPLGLPLFFLRRVLADHRHSAPDRAGSRFVPSTAGVDGSCASPRSEPRSSTCVLSSHALGAGAPLWHCRDLPYGFRAPNYRSLLGTGSITPVGTGTLRVPDPEGVLGQLPKNCRRRRLLATSGADRIAGH